MASMRWKVDDARCGEAQAISNAKVEVEQEKNFQVEINDKGRGEQSTPVALGET